MKMKTLPVVLVLVSLPSVSLAANGMREGLWEITTRMEMPGMPMEMPPTTMTHCYTREEVKDQKKVISSDKNCSVTEFKTSGSKVSWKMKCTGESAGTFSGETKFGTDSYVSDMKMQSAEANGMPVSMNVKGKRVGSCP